MRIKKALAAFTVSAGLLTLLMACLATESPAGKEVRIQTEKTPCADSIPDTAETQKDIAFAIRPGKAGAGRGNSTDLRKARPDRGDSAISEEAATARTDEKEPEEAGTKDSAALKEAATAGTDEKEPEDTGTKDSAALKEAATAGENAELAEAVFGLVNQQRTEAGLPALRWEDTLAAAARIRAEELTVKFSHTRPDGSQGADIAGTACSGENLATTSGTRSTAENVAGQWNNSGMHRENILCADFTRAGAAVYCTEKGKMYWVIVFSGD